jgi:hypothetical protein
VILRALRRRALQRVVHTIPRASGKVCDGYGCPSRCSKREKFLEDELADPQEMQDASLVVDATPTQSAAMSGSTSMSTTSRALAVPTAAHTCEVCTAVADSWTRLLRRALRLTLGAALGYVLWLRFVARPATVRAHLSALTHALARFVFDYRVVGAENLPAKGPALITAYHGFVRRARAARTPSLLPAPRRQQ